MSCEGLLLQVYKLNPERLYATYFGGDASQGLAPDEEAKAIWCSAQVDPAGLHDGIIIWGGIW